jgi:rRNA maturation RNase YbeY
MNSITFSGKTKLLNGVFRQKIRSLLNVVASQKGQTIGFLSCVFVSDEDLLKINQEHLQHDTYTDIITFDLSDNTTIVEGEIYISIERVNENAIKHRTEPDDELVRVVSHGLLHLLGYKDKTKAEAKEMREQEEACLSLWASLK